MADIVDSLFGPQPWQVQQQQNQGLQQFAAQQANRDPLQMAKYGLTMGGGLLGGAAMEGMGYQNPAVAQAQQRQSVMGMGGDLSTAAGLKAKALQFAQAGDQQTAMKLAIAAKQQEAKEQQMALEVQKQALAERKQTDIETDRRALDREKLAQAYEVAKMRSEDSRLASADRIAAQREANQIRLQIAQMTAAMKQSGESKPMTAFQATNFKQKISKSASELRSVEGATADLEAKAQALIAHPGLPAATGIAGIAPSIPGGDAAKADALIQEFKAAIKKQGLEMAREGGSIGQMTEREWPIVESMVANIDPVKLGLDGTKAQIAKAVAYAKTLTKRATAEHNDLVAAMPEEIQRSAPKAKVSFGDLK